jgi:hypothetical protein
MLPMTGGAHFSALRNDLIGMVGTRGSSSVMTSRMAHP